MTDYYLSQLYYLRPDISKGITTNSLKWSKFFDIFFKLSKTWYLKRDYDSSRLCHPLRRLILLLSKTWYLKRDYDHDLSRLTFPCMVTGWLSKTWYLKRDYDHVVQDTCTEIIRWVLSKTWYLKRDYDKPIPTGTVGTFVLQLSKTWYLKRDYDWATAGHVFFVVIAII